VTPWWPQRSTANRWDTATLWLLPEQCFELLEILLDLGHLVVVNGCAPPPDPRSFHL
jgi:hypothetical protein